jgi:hypothetical protein
MTGNETAFFESVAGERPVPTERVREFWAICARRAGKDSVASAIAAFAAATFNRQEKLRPGERGVVMCLAVDRHQSLIVLNHIRSYFADIPVLKAMVQRETAEGFELNNQIDIVVATNNFRSIRGRACLLVIMDEVAYWRDETSRKPDEELYRAVTPALASLAPDSMIIGISSPYKRSGLLYKKWKTHFAQEGDVLVIRAPTRVMNPTISQAIIDRELLEDNASARAEYLAEWRDDVTGWLAVETIESAVDTDVTVRPPNMFVNSYVAFCDPSGGSKDSFTMAIAHSENGTAVLDHVTEIKAPHSPSEAVSQIAALLKGYGLSETTGDRYASGFTIDCFAAAGITYLHSEKDRSTIYNDVLSRFNSGTVRLLDLPRLVTQLASLERKTQPGGRDKIDHPRNQKDDVANAACGALVLASQKMKPSGLLFTSLSNNPVDYIHDDYGTRARGGRGLLF